MLKKIKINFLFIVIISITKINFCSEHNPFLDTSIIWELARDDGQTQINEIQKYIDEGFYINEIEKKIDGYSFLDFAKFAKLSPEALDFAQKLGAKTAQDLKVMRRKWGESIYNFDDLLREADDKESINRIKDTILKMINNGFDINWSVLSPANLPYNIFDMALKCETKEIAKFLFDLGGEPIAWKELRKDLYQYKKKFKQDLHTKLSEQYLIPNLATIVTDYSPNPTSVDFDNYLKSIGKKPIFEEPLASIADQIDEIHRQRDEKMRQEIEAEQREAAQQRKSLCIIS